VSYVSDGGGSTTQWYTRAVYPTYVFSSATNPEFVLDLGANYRLTRCKFWNYKNYSGIGVKTFTLQFSTDGFAWSTAGTITTGIPKTVHFSSANTWEQDFLFTSDRGFPSTTIAARYVKMVVTANYAGATCADGTVCARNSPRCGFSDIAFVGTPLVAPEPGTSVSLHRRLAPGSNERSILAKIAKLPR
jgi:hypothetical protein